MIKSSKLQISSSEEALNSKPQEKPLARIVRTSRSNYNSTEPEEANESKSALGRKQRKRQPYAALTAVSLQAPYFPASPRQDQLQPLYVGCYNFEIWNLVFGISLVFGAWNLEL